MVCSLDGGIDFFDIIAGVFQRDTISTILVYNLPRMYILNISRPNKIIWLYAKIKAKNQ